ncbi:unnamed protein product [Closterium sp. NIES-65]|nr:unnamed protein product [Closterium sp. NIES-65]
MILEGLRTCHASGVEQECRSSASTTMSSFHALPSFSPPSPHFHPPFLIVSALPSSFPLSPCSPLCSPALPSYPLPPSSPLFPHLPLSPPISPSLFPSYPLPPSSPLFPHLPLSPPISPSLFPSYPLASQGGESPWVVDFMIRVLILRE